ncbi:hypothetical protein [Sphaerochaeta sp.]|jgi:hypothetical protein|uniref:hypothetical protein n=1 Tax=Sphaerochaeta sp. TaxID=1972642 RepID=UPI003D0CD044
MKQTLLAYGPSLRTSQIQDLADKAEAEDMDTLYLQEIAVGRLPREKRSGMLASLPFAGLMDEQLSFMMERAMELDCSHFTFALPAGYIRDGRFNEIEALLSTLKAKSSLILVPTIVLAELPVERLEEIIHRCFTLGLNHLCLGTGTSLDGVTPEYIETALSLYENQGVPSTNLEIAGSVPDPALPVTHRICLSQTPGNMSAY